MCLSLRQCYLRLLKWDQLGAPTAGLWRPLVELHSSHAQGAKLTSTVEGSAKRRIGLPRLGSKNTAGVLVNSHETHHLLVDFFGFLKGGRCVIYLGFPASCQCHPLPPTPSPGTWKLEGPAAAGDKASSGCSEQGFSTNGTKLEVPRLRQLQLYRLGMALRK